MLERTVAVSIFVLRRTPQHDTEVLLARSADAPGGPGWSPVGGSLRDDEREAEAALRELFEATSLEPERLYAAAFSGFDEGGPEGPGGRIGMFVAYVGGGAAVAGADGRPDLAWHPVREAAGRMAGESDRRAAERLVADFIRQAPDESLRIL